jgi:hypothetical protein
MGSAQTSRPSRRSGRAHTCTGAPHSTRPRSSATAPSSPPCCKQVRNASPRVVCRTHTAERAVGATLTATDPSGFMAAHFAAQSDSTTLRHLIQAGTPLAVRDKNKQTMLHHAARAGCEDAARFLLSLGSDACALDCTDRWSRTPLHWAVLNQHLPVAQALLEGGARPDPGTPRLYRHFARTRLLPETPLQISQRLQPGGDMTRLLERFLGNSAGSPAEALSGDR